MKPVHILDHPPARDPYVRPNAINPASVWLKTPQSTKVAIHVPRRVERARSQGSTVSESTPAYILPTTEAPEDGLDYRKK